MKKRVLSLLLALVLLAALLPQTTLTTHAASSGSCGENLTWSFNESTGKLTIKGSGKMTEWEYESNVPWRNYKSQIKTVSFPTGLTSISCDAFCLCNQLTKVTIPDKVVSIGAGAFNACDSLTSVTIPASVTSIGEWNFTNCKSLKKITVDADSKSFSSDGHGVLFNKTKSKLICCPGALEGSYTIPSTVKTIADGAFRNCGALTNVQFPKQLTTIGYNAFSWCSALKEVNLPDSVTGIGIGAFAQCSALTDVHISSSVTQIPTTAFTSCESLTSVSIPSGVTSIHDNAFYGCTALRKVELPDSLTFISQEAFAMCSALRDVSIPDGVTEIFAAAFRGCTSLKTVVLPSKLAQISSCTFEGCTALKSVTIQKGLKEIISYAFEGCKGLTEITIPGSVTNIGDSAFLNCTKLKSIAILNKSAVLQDHCIGYKGNYGNWTGISGVTIYGLSGSTAKTYASKNGVTFQSALDAPVVTASNDAATGKVKLTWTAVPLAVSYKVYRAEAKDGTYQLMKTVTDGTAYTNTGAAAGKKYWYKVKAVNGSLGGKYSAVKSRTCDLPRPVVSITRTSAGKPKLTWKKVTGAVSYKVYRCDTKTGTYKLMKTVTDGLSYTNTSAEKGKTYYYKVKAVHKNAEALSAFSLVKSIIAK